MRFKLYHILKLNFDPRRLFNHCYDGNDHCRDAELVGPVISDNLLVTQTKFAHGFDSFDVRYYKLL